MTKAVDSKVLDAHLAAMGLEVRGGRHTLAPHVVQAVDSVDLVACDDGMERRCFIDCVGCISGQADCGKAFRSFLRAITTDSGE